MKKEIYKIKKVILKVVFERFFKFEIIKLKELDFFKEVLIGVSEFQKTGVSTKDSYWAMRKLHVLTKGESSLLIGNALGKKPIENLNPLNGVLNFENKSLFEDAVDQMKNEGFFVFPTKLKEQSIKGIIDFARNNPCEFGNVTDLENRKFIFEKQLGDGKTNILGPRCDFSQDQIFSCEYTRELVYEESILAFAQAYLGCQPLLDLTAMWWSFVSDSNLKSQAAQMYHFDLDRLKFIKFFFYLTDVTTETGPHCFVKGTHNKMKDVISHDGRFDDKLINESFKQSEVVEIIGSAGTIVAVDTKGLHKGKELYHGNRLIFQIEFASTLFGQNYEKVQLLENLDNYTRHPSSYIDYFKKEK
jgi:hypothetical protein